MAGNGDMGKGFHQAAARGTKSNGEDRSHMVAGHECVSSLAHSSIRCLETVISFCYAFAILQEAEHNEKINRCRERQAVLPLPPARLERTNRGHPSDASNREQQRDGSSRSLAGTDTEAQKDQPHAQSAVDATLDVDDAACVVCNSGDDDSNMLLCDGCDDGYHIYCCTPKLKEIPDGDWFCAECRPRKRARQQEGKTQTQSSKQQAHPTHEPNATDPDNNLAEKISREGDTQTIEPNTAVPDKPLEATAATKERVSNVDPGKNSSVGQGVENSGDHTNVDTSDAVTDPLLSPAPPPPPSRPPQGWPDCGTTTGIAKSHSSRDVDPLGFTAADGWITRSHRDLGLELAASTENAMVLSVYSRRISVPGAGATEESAPNVIVAPLASSLSATDDSQRKVSIVCPRSFSEGDELEVAVPGRPLRIVAVTVPKGIAAGDLFYVRLPFNLAMASEDEHHSEEEHQDMEPKKGKKRQQKKSRRGSKSDLQAEGDEIVIASLGSECAMSANEDNGAS